MKTLMQHNEEKTKEYEAQKKLQGPQPNGIICPKCGYELVDSSPTYILCSSPPQKHIHCPECDYTGFRIA